MSDEAPLGGQAAGDPERKRGWKVDAARSFARLLKGGQGGQRSGGELVYRDEQGRERRLPADMAQLTLQERRAAIDALSRELGAPDPDDARVAAVERLTERRAAGAVSENDYQRERRRLLGGG